MKVVVTGASGLLGCELHRVLSGDHELLPLARADLDVTDAEAAVETIASARPDVVVHAAAYTQVEKAEADRETAFRVNAAGTRHVAVAADRAGAKLVHISTDYVFDGRKGSAYDEYDAPSPLNVYGASKLAAEQAAALYCRRSFIVRTSWLYGASGDSFVAMILRQAQTGGSVRAAFDEVGSPTYAHDLSRFIAGLFRTDRFGTYHASNRGACSRWEWARAIVRSAGLPEEMVEPVPAAYFGLRASRPRYSALDDFNARVNGLPRMRGWQEALHDFMSKDLTTGGNGR